MTPEETKRFDEMYDMVHENHAMLTKIRRSQKNAQMMRALYWLVIIGFTLGGYYVLQPYLTTLKNVYTGGASTYDSLKNLGNMNSEDLKSLFN